jgi:hypothetical protein
VFELKREEAHALPQAAVPQVSRRADSAMQRLRASTEKSVVMQAPGGVLAPTSMAAADADMLQQVR